MGDAVLAAGDEAVEALGRALLPVKAVPMLVVMGAPAVVVPVGTVAAPMAKGVAPGRAFPTAKAVVVRGAAVVVEPLDTVAVPMAVPMVVGVTLGTAPPPVEAVPRLVVMGATAVVVVANGCKPEAISAGFDDAPKAKGAAVAEAIAAGLTSGVTAALSNDVAAGLMNVVAELGVALNVCAAAGMAIAKKASAMKSGKFTTFRNI